MFKVNKDLAIMLDLYVNARLNKDHLLLKQTLLKVKHDILLTPDQFKLLEKPDNLPKKADYIRGLLLMGFSSKKLQEWFDTTDANISYHKNSDKEYNYSNHVLGTYRIVEYAKVEKAERYLNN